MKNWLLKTSFPPTLTALSCFVPALLLLITAITTSSLVYASTIQTLISSESGLHPSIQIQADYSLEPQEELTTRIRAQELLNFIFTRVLPAIPPELRTVFDQKKIFITFKTEAVADGLFSATGKDSANSKTDLHLELKRDLLMSANAFQLIAHEIFHALHYTLRPNEEAWVREGLAQMFEYLVLGYFNGVNAAAAFLKPGTPLMGEYDPSQIAPEQYGHDLFYFYYLWSKCGGDSLFWALIQDSSHLNGKENIDAILKNRFDRTIPAQCKGFLESATIFEVARIHNHVQYGAEPPSRDPRAWQLWSTTLPAAAPQERITQAELDRLALFSPIVLDASRTRLEKLRLQSLQAYWINSVYPFQVTQKMPEKIDKTWRIVLIRNQD